MGIYVNPKDMSKREWLDKYGTKVPLNLPWEYVEEASLPVVWMSNPYFSAVGIAYSEQELKALAVFDGRPKLMFLVKKEDLMKVTDGELAKWMEAQNA